MRAAADRRISDDAAETSMDSGASTSMGEPRTMHRERIHRTAPLHDDDEEKQPVEASDTHNNTLPPRLCAARRDKECMRADVHGACAGHIPARIRIYMVIRDQGPGKQAACGPSSSVHFITSRVQGMHVATNAQQRTTIKNALVEHQSSHSMFAPVWHRRGAGR